MSRHILRKTSLLADSFVRTNSSYSKSLATRSAMADIVRDVIPYKSEVESAIAKSELRLQLASRTSKKPVALVMLDYDHYSNALTLSKGLFAPIFQKLGLVKFYHEFPSARDLRPEDYGDFKKIIDNFLILPAHGVGFEGIFARTTAQAMLMSSYSKAGIMTIPMDKETSSSGSNYGEMALEPRNRDWLKIIMQQNKDSEMEDIVLHCGAYHADPYSTRAESAVGIDTMLKLLGYKIYKLHVVSNAQYQHTGEFHSHNNIGPNFSGNKAVIRRALGEENNYICEMPKLLVDRDSNWMLDFFLIAQYVNENISKKLMEEEEKNKYIKDVLQEYCTGLVTVLESKKSHAELMSDKRLERYFELSKLVLSMPGETRERLLRCNPPGTEISPFDSYKLVERMKTMVGC